MEILFGSPVQLNDIGAMVTVNAFVKDENFNNSDKLIPKK
jgi:hypothetical protein